MGDPLKRDKRKCWVYLHSREFAATGNNELDVIASPKELGKVGKDVCSTTPLSNPGC